MRSSIFCNRGRSEDGGIAELFEVKDELNVGLIFRMLQLLAEGHNLKMQRLLQVSEQSGCPPPVGSNAGVAPLKGREVN